MRAEAGKVSCEAYEAADLRLCDAQADGDDERDRRRHHLPTGFHNETLSDLTSSLLDTPYTSEQATYELRRLRGKGIVERIAHTHRSRLTPRGRAAVI